jgi:hypothetical protein
MGANAEEQPDRNEILRFATLDSSGADGEKRSGNCSSDTAIRHADWPRG